NLPPPTAGGMMTEPGATVLDELRAALDGMQVLVDGARPDQWSGSTPCSDWDARTLLNHVVFGNRTFTSIVNGKPPPPREQIRTMRDQDQLADDPVAAWRDSAAGLLSAFDAPGVLDRTFSSPIGEMPGAGLARLRITETLVHGWDLARSTGQPVPFAEPLARGALDFTLRQLPSGAERSTFPFAAEQAAPDNAPAIDRLAAHLGRDVGTR
ncbi:MAG TPA: TIGR03086 family metal-binding protein, partial [Nakamurella sp.]